MKADKDRIEYLHNTGLLPDVYYYQLNGKSFNENYREILNKRSLANRQKLVDYNRLHKSIDDAINEALASLFKQKR